MLMDGNFTVKWTVTEKISFFVGGEGESVTLKSENGKMKNIITGQ